MHSSSATLPEPVHFVDLVFNVSRHGFEIRSGNASTATFTNATREPSGEFRGSAAHVNRIRSLAAIGRFVSAPRALTVSQTANAEKPTSKIIS
jgi:hypothetical protein